MAGRDGTGPMGLGMKSGRGMGNCGQGRGRSFGQGQGRGFGQGAGRGLGAKGRGQFRGAAVGSNESEIQLLKQRIIDLENLVSKKD